VVVDALHVVNNWDVEWKIPEIETTQKDTEQPEKETQEPEKDQEE
jgi:hypothetical protein